MAFWATWDITRWLPTSHHQFGVGLGEAVVAAEFPGIVHALFRMSPPRPWRCRGRGRRRRAASGFVEVADDARAEGVLVGEFGHGEAPQVAQHLQDVLIHRVTWKRSCCIWPTMRRKAGR